MARVTAEPSDPHFAPRGIDLTSVPSTPVAVFAAAINSGALLAGGEMKAHLLIPFGQVPNAMPVFQYVGGVVFRITVERVPRDELPIGGWK